LRAFCVQAVGHGWHCTSFSLDKDVPCSVLCTVLDTPAVARCSLGCVLQGAFAKVYKAQCIPKGNAIVAVKILELEKVGSGIEEVRVRHVVVPTWHVCVQR